MATKVMMEALSPTMEEGRLVKWVKNVGDAVKSGDTIGEVETDKAIMELVARGDGILRAHLVPEGTTAAVGMVIGVIAAEVHTRGLARLLRAAHDAGLQNVRAVWGDGLAVLADLPERSLVGIRAYFPDP